jgi:hypothetical protein
VAPGALESDAHVDRAEAVGRADLDAALGARGLDQDAQHHGVADGRIEGAAPEVLDELLAKLGVCLICLSGMDHQTDSGEDDGCSDDGKTLLLHGSPRDWTWHFG